MAWFKVDDKLHSHPKRYRASLRAMGLWVLAGSWCSDQLTDGVIPRDLLAALGVDSRWAYFCGVANKRLAKMHELASKIVADI